MVPEGWKLATFDKHIDFLTGFAFKSAQYSTNYGDIKLLRGDNIEPGKLRWRDAKYWPVAESNNLGNYHLKQGDFVIAMDRTWISSGLKVAEVKDYDLPCLLVQRVARIRAKSSLEQSLLKQYFSAHKFEQYVKSVQTATAVPHISPNDIREFPFLLPPLPEQKKIAHILSTWDKAITTTEQLLANSQQQKKALMQQLLTGKKRLLDESGVKFNVEWKTYYLSDLAKIVMGSSPKSDAYNETGLGLPLLQGNADIKKRRSAPRVHTSEITKECKVGDILLSVRAPVGTVAISNHHACIGRGIAAISAKNGFDQDFIYQWLLWFEAMWCSFSQGSTFESVNSNDIKKIKIKSPEYMEQQKIASVLSAADDEKNSLQQKLAHLNQEKKALMQQLLTGKRRVKVTTA